MVKLKRVSVGSAFKVGAVLTAIQYAVFGLLFLLLQSAFLNTLMRALEETATRSGQRVDLAGFGFGALLLLYACGIPFAAIGGGIGWAITALFYNLTAHLVGGIEAEVDGL